MPGDFSAGTAGTGIGGLVGLAGGIFSAIQGADLAKKANDIQNQEIATQLSQDALRQQAMELSGQRQMRQNIRNAQMARSMALSTAANEGAQFSSGLQGAYANVSGQANTNTANISENLQIGRSMFGLEAQLAGEKQQAAMVQGEQATNQAVSGIFGSISKAGGPLGSLAGMIPFG